MSYLKFKDPAVKILDIETNEFEQVHYHSATKANDGNIILFGGKEGDGCVKEIRIYDTKGDKIQAPQEQKNTDCLVPTSGHAAWFYNDKFWWFGGEQECLEGYINDVFSYDPKKKEWEKHEVGGTWEIPCPREGHCCHYIGNDQVVLFGGANERRYFNTIFFLNLKTKAWSRLHPRGIKKEYVPKARFYFGSEFYNGIVYVVGGWLESRESKKIDNSRLIYRFDVSKKLWIEPIKFEDGAFPEGTASVKTTMMGDWMILFGGYKPHFEEDDHRITGINLKTGKWKFGKNLKFEGEVYKKLEHPTITAIGNKIYFVGGNQMQEQVNHNVHFIDLEDMLDEEN